MISLFRPRKARFRGVIATGFRAESWVRAHGTRRMLRRAGGNGRPAGPIASCGRSARPSGKGSIGVPPVRIFFAAAAPAKATVKLFAKTADRRIHNLAADVNGGPRRRERSDRLGRRLPACRQAGEATGFPGRRATAKSRQRRAWLARSSSWGDARVASTFGRERCREPSLPTVAGNDREIALTCPRRGHKLQ